MLIQCQPFIDQLSFSWNAGLISWFVPCYVFGKISETVGESCLLYGLLEMIPIVNCYFTTIIRGKVREQKDIEGTCARDLLVHICCPICAFVQEWRVSLTILPLRAMIHVSLIPLKITVRFFTSPKKVKHTK